MNFLKIFFWEFIQNLPVFAGFVWAFEFWQQGKIWAAAICIMAGSIGGPVLIALTESKKVAGHKEPSKVLLVNIGGMLTIVLALVVYLSADWGGWLTDLAIGALCGCGLGIGQSVAAKEKIGVRHCIALAVASTVALIIMRWLIYANWPAWVNVLSMSLLATLIIVPIDYPPKKSDSTSSI